MYIISLRRLKYLQLIVFDLIRRRFNVWCSLGEYRRTFNLKEIAKTETILFGKRKRKEIKGL